MGLARLSKVTVIAPRSEYAAVARALAEFEDFHPLQDGVPNFDPVIQELTVKAVRLFAQADQAVKELDIQLMPGAVDIVFRGVKIPRDSFEASTWEELLNRVEAELEPIVEEVRIQRTLLQKLTKEETDAQTMKDALGAVSGFSVDLSHLPSLHRLKVSLFIVGKETVDEFRNSVPESVFRVHSLSEAHSLVLVGVRKSDESKLDKVMKSLELKPLVIPAGFPQNPAEAYQRLTGDHETAKAEREKVEAKLAEIKERSQGKLLSIRELTEVARSMLDEARVSGGLKRMATISGYVPAKREEEFRRLFGKWIVYSEQVGVGEDVAEVPSLFENPVGLKTFQLITREQGTPGNHEVDPTPLISFVFPVFFGLMFGDVGDGIILTLVALLIRERGTGNIRQWGNIFLAAGISAIVFGALVGEFFGSALGLYQLLSPVTLQKIEILQHPLGVDTVDITGIQNVMIISILIGVAHLVTGLSLDVYQTLKARETVEAITGKLPTLTMYVSGVGYGIAFIGAGYSFNVLKRTDPAPLLGVPNNLLGSVSLTVLIGSMIALFCGKAIAIKMGKMKGQSVAGALSDGGLEVFERISQFLSNTISYVRLAIMLLVHAVLLLIVNNYFPPTNPIMIGPWVVLHLLVVAFEAFVVYVQDLRLHIYEFFTKFYEGKGTPFRKILPDRVRIEIKWH